MTNPPAANEPAAADQPADRDTATDNEPRYEADYGPADETVAEPAPTAEIPAPTAEMPAQEAGDETPTAHVPGDEPAAHAPHEEPTAHVPHEEPTAHMPDEEPPAPQSAPPPPPGSAPPPGYTPPPGPMPPPFAAAPPPPPGPGFNRQNLVRPTSGRYIAGVCAAIGRATNTDPALWRVLFAVLTLAGGVGLLGYLLGWLLIPAEGDSASPLEALFGRGKSNTSGPLVIVVGILAVLTFAFVVSDNVGPAVIGLAVVIGTVALLLRGGQGDRSGAPPPQQGYGYPGYPGYPSQPAPGAPAPAPGSPPPAAFSPPISVPPPPSGPPVTAPPALPPMPAGGYRPPFAPHGPYAGSSPYAQSLGYPAGPPGSALPPYPGLSPMPPKAPKPKRPKSKLGRLTLSVTAIALGMLVVIDLAGGVSVPGEVYAAVALTVIAAGLIVGAWFGRARWLIPVGVITTIVLASATVDARVDNVQRVDNIDAAPISVAEILPDYHAEVGDIHLDLSRVDFGNEPVNVDVSTSVGTIDITLPPNVDATVSVDVQGGDIQLFDKRYSGINQHQEVTNLGEDGTGGGQIRITGSVKIGDLEVHR